MAHFAEIDENNIVLRILVTSNDEPGEGHQWLVNNLGGTWIKTSYNAVEGKKRDPDTGDITDEPGFRKNYAGIGYTYDEVRDAFIPPKPEALIDLNGNIVPGQWVLDEETCIWDWIPE